MTLDEAIKHAEELAEDEERNAGWFYDKERSCYKKKGKCTNEHRQLAEWLKELKQLGEQLKWIPVDERLSAIHNYSENYLVTLKRGGVHIAMFTECDGKHWWTYDDVIAWMPLPKPYESQKRSGK